MANDTHDILIVGGGIAGLFCALKLVPRPVTILTAAPLGEGASSAWAQGGIAAAVAEGDTPDAHARDTIAAGAGLVDEDLALAMAREAPASVHDLLAYGVPFDLDLLERLAVGREAAHSACRIVHVKGDLAGRAIMAALVAAVREVPSIRVLEGFVAEDLLTSGASVSSARVVGENGVGARANGAPTAEARVIGVRARSADTGRVNNFLAHAVVLASGGIGHLYAVTTNPREAHGSGLAIAARAGAVLADTEFVQFHPTAIAVGCDPAPLASEAIRGEGAILINGAGERFMQALHPQGELAPRDIVARGVFAELAAGRGAFLDARAAIGAAFPDHFPTVYASCIEAGIDPVHEPIPIAPAAHYHMGGVATDASGRTSLGGLWAAGEVASTGVHGANRLASNSLLEALVFAARIAQDISSLQSLPSPLPFEAEHVETAPPMDLPAERRLREIMSRHVGVMRDEDGLARALDAIVRIEHEAKSPSLRNMATAALLVTAAACRRRESRGAHFRVDHPKPDRAQAHRTRLTLADARAVAQASAAPSELLALRAS